MSDHLFLFTKKNWLGEGKIQLSMVEEELGFYTRWNVPRGNPQDEINAFQEIEIKGMSDPMHNRFLITEISGTHFRLELENAALGIIEGKGIIKDNLIAWEFRDNELGFEGFEFYELQPDGTYTMRGEYSTPDQYRTVIRGKIWERKEA